MAPRDGVEHGAEAASPRGRLEGNGGSARDGWARRTPRRYAHGASARLMRASGVRPPLAQGVRRSSLTDNLFPITFTRCSKLAKFWTSFRRRKQATSSAAHATHAGMRTTPLPATRARLARQCSVYHFGFGAGSNRLTPDTSQADTPRATTPRERPQDSHTSTHWYTGHS